MARTPPEPRPVDARRLAATDAWVRRLNALAAKLDESTQTMHPSAWPETLARDTERWRKLAQGGPTR